MQNFVLFTGYIPSSDSPNKTPTEEVFSDVFENIQMQLDMIEGLRGKSWTMEQKLDILR